MNPSAEQDPHSIPAPDTPASWRTLAGAGVLALFGVS
ncbi:MAG: hypothetical protein RLZZ573_779, partial [Pseudomonadota bacterium]